MVIRLEGAPQHGRRRLGRLAKSFQIVVVDLDIECTSWTLLLRLALARDPWTDRWLPDSGETHACSSMQCIWDRADYKLAIEEHTRADAMRLVS